MNKKRLVVTAALAASVAFSGVTAAGTASAAEAKTEKTSVTLQQLYSAYGINLDELLSKLQQNGGFNWSGLIIFKPLPKPTPGPSASPKPSPTAKPTTTPAPTAKPTVTPSPTAKPTTTPAPTAKPTVTPSPTAKPTTTPQPTTAPIGDFEQQVVSLVNQERAKQGLGALSSDAELAKVADVKAKDMYDNNYFDHNSPTYGSPFDMMKSFGVSYNYAGENIAKGQRTAEQVMNDWMNSPGHRANIMNGNYTKIGVAYYNGVWVQMFKG
ncbi:CAP domain-containing protein [Paenibacillus pasadenensis]|uniref:CAP domain-containing protein n=1 Tax=Paenibacillus pasadenensis TaxID=217090 RepID=UPI00204228A5|nr:CAP domain-containing protein [Paenibacillus pasadenensis]MCM3748253.1 CAP domain-containing protein [Paenibacillus pasadenensis]